MAAKFPDNTFVAPLLVAGNRLAIAEAPGQTEADLGTPLVGASGNWLRGKEVEPGKRTGGLYRAAGVDQSTISFINTIQCKPPGNVYPTDPDARTYISKEEAQLAVTQCHNNHLTPILRSRDWARIDVLGDKALRTICAVDGGIMRWRGSPLAVPEIDPDKPLAVPTIHPSAISRDQSLLPAVVSDLKKSLITPPEFYDPHPSLETVRAFTATEFAFDIECRRDTGEITMVGLAAEPFHAICVPAKGVYFAELRRIFRNATSVIGHNCIQFDLPRLQAVGISIRASCATWDTMLMQHLLQPDLPHDLGFLGSFFTNKPAWKHLSGDDEELYCCRDVDVTLQCWRQLRPMLRQESLLDLYERVQVPLARICHQFHELGFSINPARLADVRQQFEAEVQTLEGQLPECLRTHQVAIRRRELAPPGTLSPKTGKPLKYLMVEAAAEETPWKSSAILKQYFYTDCGLPVQTHAKTNEPTVDKTAIPKLLRAAGKVGYTKFVGLKKAEEVSRALRALQKLRQFASLLSTFTKEEFGHVERIHASFNVHGTASGRLSSSDPNLQNIPEAARYIYVPSHTGWRVFDVDFSSLENRLTAWFAQDYERLARLSEPGFNEHKWTTSQFFDIPYDEVVKDNSKDAPYGKAKRIGHGSNYGMGPLKISRLFDLPLDEVRVLCEKWRAVNSKTVSWQLETAARAKKDGYLTTPFGRKRWFYCPRPEELVPLSNGTWKRVGDLSVGEEVVGFDEAISRRNSKFRRATITANTPNKALRMRIVTDKGDVVVTETHAFPVAFHQEMRWITAKYLKVGDFIPFYNRPWQENVSGNAQWVAGFLDGEGYVAGDGWVGFAQNDGQTLERLKVYCAELGYTVSISPRKNKDCNYGRIIIPKARAGGGAEILGTLRPIRLLERYNRTFEGNSIAGTTGKAHTYARVLAVEPEKFGDIVELSTTTNTLILNGLLSHNTDSAYTESLSFLPQSTGADITFRCLIALLYERIGWPEDAVQKIVQVYQLLPKPANILVQVHDSFVGEAPVELLPEVRLILERVMTQAWPELGGFSIPVEWKEGPSWGETKSL